MEVIYVLRLLRYKGLYLSQVFGYQFPFVHHTLPGRLYVPSFG